MKIFNRLIVCLSEHFLDFDEFFSTFRSWIFFFIFRIFTGQKGLTRRRFARKLEGTYALLDFSFCKFDWPEQRKVLP